MFCCFVFFVMFCRFCCCFDVLLLSVMFLFVVVGVVCGVFSMLFVIF